MEGIQDLVPEEVALFRALVKPAIVLLLMLRLDRACGARELADILGLDEHTVGKYLRQLSKLNLVARSARVNGYLALQGGRQLILGRGDFLSGDPCRFDALAGATVKNLQPATAASTTLTVENGGDEEEVEAGTKPTARLLQSGPRKRPAAAGGSPETPDSAERARVIAALLEAGIGEPKRSELAALPHVTPTYVRAWEMQLKRDKGARYSTGLLVHVLASGDPHRPVNERGHLVDCECPACRRLDSLICPDCWRHPCVCEGD